MQGNIKFRTFFITFMLIVSSLSILYISPNSVKAIDGDGFDEILYLTGLHPYITAGWYEYYGNKSIQIEGDVEFNLYFSSTLSTQTLWNDDLEISIYSLDIDTFQATKLENANTTVTIKQEFFGETVQKINVTLQNIEYNLSDGEILIFVVEVIQTGKPIGNIIEKRYQEKLQERAKKVAEFLNKSGNENLAQIGDIIMQILGTAEEFGISAEEFGSLANSFSSSSFVYNSKDYPSSVILPLSSGENQTLYFHSALYDEEFQSESFVTMEKEIPNGTVMTWPTKFFSMDPYEPGVNSEEWLYWFTTWLYYIEMNVVPPEEKDNDLIKYYLTEEKTLVLDEPEDDKESRFTLSSDPQVWEGFTFSRNKIINNATAELFVYYPKVAILRKITVNATLYDNEDVIASVQEKVDRTNILEFISQGPGSPTVFEFDLAGKEIWNGHNLKLSITSSGMPLIYPLRKVKLLCGSADFPSSITFNFTETDNIIIEKELEDKDVVPGGSAKFTLYIYSKYREENLEIEVTPKNPDDLETWSIEYPNKIQIDNESREIIFIFVNSTNNNISAYNDKINLFFNITGKTGFVSKKVDVEVSDDAVDYYIDLKIPPDKEIKHGTSGTYKFKIKNENTGFWYDSYEFEAFSEHNFDVDILYNEEELERVGNGEEVEVRLKVFIPEDSEICYDVLELNITSKESIRHEKEIIWTARVITKVIGPNIFEHIYNYFESVSSDIGLDEFLGDYAAAFLIFVIIFIILIFLIPIIFFIRKEYIEIICLDRIKEIDPDDKAEFEVTLRNPTKYKHNYRIQAEEVNSSSGRWDISVDTENITIGPKQTKSIDLSVKPTDYIKKDDWVEVKIVVNPIDKKKKEELSTVTSIKDSKPELKIIGAFSWPKIFRKGDRINTSFRINNIGNVSMDNVSVILYINGEEKNKVDDITIPRKGYAEIEIPWIAENGKNEVNIVVK